MRVLIVGATGTIGTAVSMALGDRHDVIRAAATRGDLRVDIDSPQSIENLFTHAGSVDAVVCTAGRGAFGPFHQLHDDDFALGLGNKLMGQVRLVQIGLEHVTDGGSFTLTSGIFGESPVPGVTALAMVNGAINSFVKAAALDMPRQLRINAVAPPWVTETLETLGMDSASGMPAADVAKAYVAGVEGAWSGDVLHCDEFAQPMNPERQSH